MEKQQNKYSIKITLLRKIVFLIISLLGFVASAQINEPLDYSNPKTYEISGIIVNGANNLNDNTLIAITELSIGNTIKIPGDEITKAITKLWKQGLFSDVDISTSLILMFNGLLLSLDDFSNSSLVNCPAIIGLYPLIPFPTSPSAIP